MAGHPTDGALASWEDLERVHEGGALFVGNGLSMHVWQGFGYASLFDQAKGSSVGLQTDDLAIFEALGTENFETALSLLHSATLAAQVLGQPSGSYHARYQSIRRALSGAILDVHPELSHVPDEARRVIKQVMLNHRIVFSTSYDLLLYWAMGHEEDYQGLKDCFWGPRCSFVPGDANLRGGVGVYFLHGGMHLAVMSDGSSRKIVRTPSQNVLDQFGRPIDGDTNARPLIVTEGSSVEKRRAIADNAYLAHALRQLESCTLPITIFGSSLSQQDQHVVDAVNAFPDRSVAVSIRRPSGSSARREIRARQAHLRARLATDHLYFFDAATHPLGHRSLRYGRFWPSLLGRSAA